MLNINCFPDCLVWKILRSLSVFRTAIGLTLRKHLVFLCRWRRYASSVMAEEEILGHPYEINVSDISSIMYGYGSTLMDQLWGRGFVSNSVRSKMVPHTWDLQSLFAWVLDCENRPQGVVRAGPGAGRATPTKAWRTQPSIHD